MSTDAILKDLRRMKREQRDIETARRVVEKFMIDYMAKKRASQVSAFAQLSGRIGISDEIFKRWAELPLI